ncbi:MAG: hypothetical protein M1829_002668 [Trizodia sp. TS-e1964]|nr:MAG: hypothetical protein M1829_002668 [Trizodia sp. TS-e1964]
MAMQEKTKILIGAPSFAEVAKSRLYTFVLGDRREKFHIHSAAIDYFSPVLRKMMNIGMAESAIAEAELKDFEPSTFALFTEWIYTADYSTNQPKTATTEDLRQVESRLISYSLTSNSCNLCNRRKTVSMLEKELELFEISGTYPESCSNCEGQYKRSKYKKGSSHWELPEYVTSVEPVSVKAVAWEAFIKRKIPFPSRVIRPAPSESSTPHYSRLIKDVELYAFAEKYEVPQLQALVVHKVHQVLKLPFPSTNTPIDILEALQCVYDMAPEKEDPDTDLRDLLVSFVACKLDAFLPLPDFLALLHMEGDLSGDLFKKLNAGSLLVL